MSPSPWYQFSLRSLLLLTLFVAVLCSYGVSVHWVLSAVIGTILLIGGVTGGNIARSQLGFWLGMLLGLLCSMIAAFACVLVGSIPRFLPLFPCPPLLFWQSTPMTAAVIAGSLIGGICGGLLARPRSKR